MATETTVMPSKPTTMIVKTGAIMSIMSVATSNTTAAKWSGDTMIHMKSLTEVESPMTETFRLHKEFVATATIMPTDVRTNVRWFLTTDRAVVVTAVILEDTGAALEVVLNAEHTVAAANVVETRNPERVARVLTYY